MTLDIVECEACKGKGEYEAQIGGDGYGDRCCALADVPCVCPGCDGVGYVHVDGRKLRPEEVV